MRNNENNIIFNVRNIALNLKNTTTYFTGKAKIITLVSIIIMSSFTNITSTSALSYESEVGIGFTFNPTISISLSPSDLVISNLTPGTTAESNSINVSVATNAAYGYTLSATVDNTNLTHTNETDAFGSIATNANLPSLNTDNTWGYSTKLPNETSWNNYNGLSSSTSTTLIDNSNTADSTGSIDFKIGAKASSTQASGTYTNTINFIAVSKVAPMSLLDSFIASGAEQLNGYFKMQDMTHDICSNVDIEESELQLIDVRDNKVYWVAKLKDGNCWMTQNLDLDLDSNRTYTHWDTDLGWSTDNGNSIDESATWKPVRSTINFTGAKANGWQNSNTEPYSANPGDVYYYTSNSNADDIQYNSLKECANAEHDDCVHYHAGNYYNWSAAVGSNDTGEMINNNALNSSCPSSWRLPSSFTALTKVYNIASSSALRLRNLPLYFVRANCIYNRNIVNLNSGIYWESRSGSSVSYAYNLGFSSSLYDGYYGALERSTGFSVRCLAR